jgi:hypothetical protein
MSAEGAWACAEGDAWLDEKARIWLIVAIRQETNPDRTR